MIDLKRKLRLLTPHLRDSGSQELAVLVEDAACGSDETFRAFLISNYLWGGSGSIADQGGMRRDGSDVARYEVVKILIDVGSEQIRIGLTNARTEFWVRAFRNLELFRSGV